MIVFTKSILVDFNSHLDASISNVVIFGTDNDLLKGFINEFYNGIRTIKETSLFYIPDGEDSKGLEVVNDLWMKLVDSKANRSTLIVAIGGGATLDVVAFCSFTFMRGLNFWSIPTTLLAMVDAAIGGKNGINFSGYKNLIGSFYNPNRIWICIDFIKTLSQIELKNGWAECLKHALIEGKDLWKEIQAVNWSLTDESLHTYWYNLVRRNALYKDQITKQDFYDNGLREVLNAGHTFAHALESFHFARNESISHGKAVAWGLLFESLVGNEMSFEEFEKLPKNHWLKVVEELVTSNYSPLPTYSFSNFEEVMFYAFKDKKNRTGTIKASVICSPGVFRLHQEIDFHKIFDWIQKYRLTQIRKT
jgi:3-dehydroquinate synthase